MILSRKSALIAAFVVALLLSSFAATRAVSQTSAATERPGKKNKSGCPSRVELDLLLGKASRALEQAQYFAAVNALQPVSPLDCSARISLLLAAAYEASNNLPQAEQTLAHAQSAWPDDTSIATSLAREYLTDGDSARAAHALDHLHASRASPWQEIQLSVVVFLSAQRLSKAEALARLGYSTYPSVDALLLLANTLQLEGRYKEVIALLDGHRASYATSAKFLVTVAESEYDANIFDHARQDVEAAITRDASLYQAHYLLGNILMKQGDAAPAAAAYRSALQLAPDQPRTYYHLALSLRAMHDEAGEESVLITAVAADSKYGLAHCELGRIFLNQNRVPEAITQLELAVEDNDSSEEAYSLLARAYNKAGEREKAEAAVMRLGVVRKANHQAHPVGGNIQAKANDATPE